MKPKIDGQRNLTSSLATYKLFFFKIFFKPKIRRFSIFQKTLYPNLTILLRSKNQSTLDYNIKVIVK
jgi:hypothetical protein